MLAQILGSLFVEKLVQILGSPFALLKMYVRNQDGLCRCREK